MTAASWVTQSEKDKELPFKLAWLGFDVWLGSNRGSGFSQYSKHVAFNPIADSEEFYNYTFSDMAQYDLPA